MYRCTVEGLMGWGGGWPGMFGLLIMLMLLGYFIHRISGNRRCNDDRRDSLAILKRRLASGEISLEEFEKLKNVI